MATSLQKQRIRNIGIYGVIRPAEVDDALIPENAVTEAMNFHFDRKGAATVRPGLTALGSTVLNARPCVGMHNMMAATAIAVFSDGGSSAIFVWSGSSWGLSLSEGTASVRIRFADFGSFAIVPNFNYNTLSSMRYWSGIANGASYWRWTGNPINGQNLWGYNPRFIEVYKSRVYVAGDPLYPGRLFFSSVITAAGNITWAPTTDFVDINPNDGEDTTGLKRFSLELLLFKPNYIYRFRTSSVDPDPLIKIGTRSHESIVEGKRGLYFHHDTGFYRYAGSYPQEISRPIIDFINAIPYSQFDDIIGWKDNDHIYWSVGNLTIKETGADVVWRNVILRYTESSEIWTVYSYASDIRGAVEFNSGSTISVIVGSDLGVVATHNSGVTDVGEPIKFRIVTKWYEWEGVETTKIIQQIVALTEKAQEAQLMYQVDDNPEWQTLGQIRKYLNFFDSLSIKFHRIRFKVTGVSRFEAPMFLGLEITQGINEGVIVPK